MVSCVGRVQKNNDPQSIYDTVWMQHLTQGRLAEEVWEFISTTETDSTCGW